MRTLSRDPFARHDVVRLMVPRSAFGINAECAWCGARVLPYPDGSPIQGRTVKRLYRYGTLPDGRSFPTCHPRAFCSKSCYHSYAE